MPPCVEFVSYCGRVDRDIREEEDEDEISIVEERRGFPSGSSPPDRWSFPRDEVSTKYLQMKIRTLRAKLAKREAKKEELLQHNREWEARWRAVSPVRTLSTPPPHSWGEAAPAPRTPGSRRLPTKLPPYCKKFLIGACNIGASCQFVHVLKVNCLHNKSMKI